METETISPQNTPSTTETRPKSKRQKKREKVARREQRKAVEKEQQSSKGREDDWISSVDRQNAAFEKYYKAQSIIQDDDEWVSWINTLKEDLPTTFRITGSRSTAADIQQIIQNVHIPNLQTIEYDGNTIPPPVQIPWYPNGLAWQLNVHKNVIRKVPQFKKLQNFLVYEAEAGGISRQEAVSMIPPLVLDVEPHHKVLDMCAAPGSKTAQLIEALHANPEVPPSGIVVANDSDYKRAGLLVHQASRLPSPGLIFTNVDASIYPSVQVSSTTNPSGKSELLFDRILADVPCTGDGTLRKNPIIWRHWHTGNGNGLHGLQLRILLRAMKMLAKGGRIVYSTCSMNPIENEAVVAAALKATSGEYELVDLSHRLPELKRAPGLHHWKVAADKACEVMVSSWEEFQARSNEIGAGGVTKVSRTMFPPNKASELNLERCWRIYPHSQNTGGFFVAALERIERIRATSGVKRTQRDIDNDADVVEGPVTKKPRSDRAQVQAEDDSTSVREVENDLSNIEVEDLDLDPVIASTAGTGRLTGGTYKEEPYTYLNGDSEEVLACLKQLKINFEMFPRHSLFIRNLQSQSSLRSIYLSNDLVKAIITSNEPSRLRFISAGIKIIGKQESASSRKDENGKVAAFRVLSDGISSVVPYMKKEDILQASLKDLQTFLKWVYPLQAAFEDPFRSQILTKELGHHVLCIAAGEFEGASVQSPMYFPIWKSGISLSLMIDKRAKSALSLRLFGEDITVTKVEKNEKTEESIDESAQIEQ